MGWQDQGRQSHGWFGDGTSEAPLSAAEARNQRIASVAYGAIAVLPSDQRVQGAGLLDKAGLSNLTEVIRAWGLAAKLDTASFAAHFLGRAANDPIVEPLRAAARAADLADSPAALREAAIRLAGAMQAVGLDRWRSFVTDAQARTLDPATIAAVQQSFGPRDPLKDAIHPVYPLETLLGIAASASTGGVPAAVRAVSGALLRQVVPRKPDPRPANAPDAATDPARVVPEQSRIVPRILKGHQDKHIVGTNNYDGARRRSFLDSDVDANELLSDYAFRGEPRGKIPVGEPGSKEVIDTHGKVISRYQGKTIGVYVDPANDLAARTTRATIHYGKRGAHIVPARPRDSK